MQSISLLSVTPEELRSLIVEAVSSVMENHQTPPSPREENEAYLTREQTAAALHVSKLTLRNHEKRGILKPHRIGRRVLYSRTEIDAVLAAGRL
jgi:ribosomal protein L24